MDRLTVKIIPSDISEDEKQRLLWKVFDLLLEAACQGDEANDSNKVSTPMNKNFPLEGCSPSFR